MIRLLGHPILIRVTTVSRRFLVSRADHGHALLSPPRILYSNNHLLVVNKPPGWHSMPATNNDDTVGNKSIVSHLQRQQLGGGSSGTFLSPLHRLDQPCSGVLLLAKTSRAASRIQSNWKRVQKLYWCVLDAFSNLDQLVQASSRPVTITAASGNDDNDHHEPLWMELKGRHEPNRKRSPSSQNRRSNVLKGWSVTMVPIAPIDKAADDDDSRSRTIRWRRMILSTRNSTSILLAIETNQGSRHMIRSLLGMVDCPIAGDLRYGASRPLPDRSVALHARRIKLPANVPLGQQQNVLRVYEAGMPELWEGLFNLREDDIT